MNTAVDADSVRPPSTAALLANPAETADQIAAVLSRQVAEVLRRRGAIVAMSGGVH